MAACKCLQCCMTGWKAERLLSKGSCLDISVVLQGACCVELQNLSDSWLTSTATELALCGAGASWPESTCLPPRTTGAKCE